MIVGFGVDVLDIERVDLKLANRVLTEDERMNRARIDEEYIAGRFALKEAYFKALGTGIDGNSFQDVSFLNGRFGEVYPVLHRYVRPVCGVFNRIHASLAHDKFVYASVILEKERGGIYIGLGSNLGDRLENLRAALGEISEFCDIISVSKVYETKPYGKTDQPDFLNCVAEIDTDLTPSELLEALLNVERSLGRVRTEKWGPRVIDLDILFYGNLVIRTPELVVPHYDFENRIFFVLPMRELNAHFVHPVLKTSMEKLYQKLLDEASAENAGIEVYGDV
ncbi:2-amino-4-hydroxy-6-hydroxymethyldihydropteridine diphosphokinase [Fervidobacterium thailandense]|uniref:Holo-[acyl-carrier-protein] synthase n=1 Tax=Fervidobacterium thailandense TaxID=1008305 RepID=A0A1E3G496_9BACT|nr:2-amino-4-hydroxy-6-hydroxymethyldihydropteridine diphosphokinase [Fervidobacterium thailandense]ODN31111.1 7,8-dihydro-6-hydroxymethylpterin-pyrophosphokinase [Fervidobacterium thailandense]